MSKAPKRPRQRDDLRPQGDAAGVHQPKPFTRKPRATSKRRADTAPDSPTAEIPNAGVEGSEGNPVASLPPAQGSTLARNGDSAAEGNQNAPDRQNPHGRIRAETEQPAQTVALADDLAPPETNQGVASHQPQSSAGEEMRADLTQGITRHPPFAQNLELDSRENAESPSHIAPEDPVQPAVGVRSPRLQDESDRVRNASGRVKVWTQEGEVRRAPESHGGQGSTNPIYILAAITLGIPALLLIMLVGMNPGIQDGTFTTVVTFLVVSAFVTGVVFEIKKLVDQPADADHS